MESYLRRRNVISNDLNPFANYLTSVITDENVSIDDVLDVWQRIEAELKPYVDEWYNISINNVEYSPISVLRNNNNVPIAFTYRDGRVTRKKNIPADIADAFMSREENTSITDWYPNTPLIANSRISAVDGMTVPDLFTKRTLACHSRLLSLINRYSTQSVKDLLLIAFTANLANCSKLVPPIKSRGELAQGAWMTGFYIGETYIENNVLHYYKNRLNKAIAGKKDFIATLHQSRLNSNIRPSIQILNNDAKHLPLQNQSVDYVFTDPPYGDTVPYFEQSIIWNAWLNLVPDYLNEIVISDSNKRAKDIEDYSNGIAAAISEINRVLRPDRYFSITYHSLSGHEWKAITNACLMNNFIVEKFEWLEQATLPPRQLNRIKTIKGDVLVTFKKSGTAVPCNNIDEDDFRRQLNTIILACIKNGNNDTNSIMMSIMEWILRSRVIIHDIDVFDYLNKTFNCNSEGKWQ